MHRAKTKIVDFKGTPASAQRVLFLKPNGESQVALVQGIDRDWNISVFLDEGVERVFFVGSSPDDRHLIVERWCRDRFPQRIVYKTKKAQKEDLGKDASAFTHDQIVELLRTKLTVGDNPPVVKPEEDTIELVEATRWDRSKKSGDFEFVPSRDLGERTTKPYYKIRMVGLKVRMISEINQETETVLRTPDGTQIFFLHTLDSGYFLENVRHIHHRIQRRQATSPTASGTVDEIIRSMIPDLVVTSDKF